jgi:hypothetical protein
MRAPRLILLFFVVFMVIGFRTIVIGGDLKIKLPYTLDDRPGAKSFEISEILSDLFPELKNPRRMQLRDLGKIEEQEEFLEGGYTFVLRGDFNGDNKGDIAFVGKHKVENREDVFFAILSINKNTVSRAFFQDRLCEKGASLMIDLGLKPGVKTIVVHCTIASDYCGYVCWDGQKYVAENCHSE